jgi:hypothetical protein
VHVESPCPQDSDCGSGGKELCTILHNIHVKFELFLSRCSFSRLSDLPGIRQKLYEIPRLYPSDNKMWNKRLQILCSAQSIMQWLPGIPLSAQQTFSSPRCSAEPGKQAVAGRTIDSLALKRVPAMINLQWGSSPTSQDIFCGGQHHEDDLSPNGNIRDMLLSLLAYLSNFEDLATKAFRNCLYPVCSQRDEIFSVRWNSILKPGSGCLRLAAMEEALFILAHGVADGFRVAMPSQFLKFRTLSKEWHYCS